MSQKIAKVGLALLGCVTAVSTPIMYIHYKGEAYFNNQEYKKAISYYEYLETLSLNYTKKIVKSYCLESLKKYHDPKLYKISDSIRGLDNFRIKVSKEVYAHLMEIDPVSQIFTNISKLYHSKDSFTSPQELYNETNKIKNLIKKAEIKEKTALYEILSLIYLEKNKNTIASYHVYDYEIEKERKHFQEAYKEYKEMEKNFNTSIFYKYHAHKFLVQIYNEVSVDHKVEVDSFEEEFFLAIKKMYETNQNVAKKHGNSFSLHKIFPFATEKDIYTYYKETVKSYQSFPNSMSSEFIINKLDSTEIPYKVRKRYAAQFPLANLIMKIVNLERNRGLDMFLKTYEERYGEILRGINGIELEEKNMLYEFLQIVHVNILMNKVLEGIEDGDYKNSIKKLHLLKKEYQLTEEELGASPAFSATCHKTMMKLKKVDNEVLEVILKNECDFSISNFIEKVEEENRSLIKKYGGKYSIYRSNTNDWQCQYNK